MVENYCKCGCVESLECEGAGGLLLILRRRVENKQDFDCARETPVQSTQDTIMQNVEKWSKKKSPHISNSALYMEMLTICYIAIVFFRLDVLSLSL
jgi:hypothetical protein